MTLQLDDVLADRSRWRASECSIAKAMEVIGTRSAVLILREAYYGTTRFDDFTERVGVTPSVASARLRELVDSGLLEQVPYQEPGRRTRHEYRLTDSGWELLPAVLALMSWGDRRLQHDGGPLEVVDRRTGAPVEVAIVGAGGEMVDPSDLLVRPRKR